MENTIIYEIGGALYINLTNACTNKCKFCIRDFSGIKGYDLWLQHQPETEDVIAELEKADLGKYEEVVFCGYGEPMLRLPQLLAVCDYIRGAGDIKIRLNTNGLANLIYKRDVTPELKNRLDTISISLNAKDADQYQSLCEPEFGKESFPAILDFTEKCKAYVPEVIMSVVDTFISEEDIVQCEKIAQQLGVKFRVRHFDD